MLRIRIQDNISENLVTIVWIKNTEILFQLFSVTEPHLGFGMKNPDPGWKHPDPGWKFHIRDEKLHTRDPG